MVRRRPLFVTLLTGLLLHTASASSRDENRLWLSGEHVLPWRNLLLANRGRFDQRWVEGVDGFEQNRLRGAVGLRLFGRIRTETGYEWQRVERRSRGSEDRHVLFVELALSRELVAAAAENPFVVARKTPLGGHNGFDVPYGAGYLGETIRLMLDAEELATWQGADPVR